MKETIILTVRILPCPVLRRELAIIEIKRGYILTLIVILHTLYGFLMQLCANSYRIETRHVRYVARLMAGYENAISGYFPHPYSDPRPVNTIITVFKSISISSLRLQLSIYAQSNLTTSSKSFISERPLTCHMPVIPGLRDKRLF